ncbi:hypothetical protein ACCC88_10565 [Sphingomonas sp. Sphisp140]|uniref:hypothetical protein n=1 Tax=unclassified Sphingomonas TaxID=196159 RepID=UPI0039AF8D34
MMRWLPLVALLTLSSPAVSQGDTRFDAAGRVPKWRLTIAQGRFELRQLGPLKTRDGGAIDTVERAPGKVRINATIVYDQLVPLGGRARNGQPLMFVESQEEPLSIEVVEAPCQDDRRRTYPTQVTAKLGSGEPWQGCGDSLAVLEAGLAKTP